MMPAYCLAQPLDEQLVQPVASIQRDPVAGSIDLLVAPGSFHEATRHLHAFAVEVVVICGPDAECPPRVVKRR